MDITKTNLQTYYQLDINIPKRVNSSGVLIPATKLHIETTYPNVLKGSPNDGKPVVIFFPGGPGDGMFLYKLHSIKLVEHAHLVYWDPRGCGSSAKGRVNTYDMDTYIDDANVLRKVLHLKNFIIFGTSYGSVCALGFAFKYPKSLSALILGSPVASSEYFDLARINLLKWGNAAQKKWGLKLLNGNLKTEEDVIKFFYTLMPLYSDAAKKSKSAALKMEKGVYNWKALIAGFKKKSFLHNFDYLEKLPKISLPTLIMTGKRDWICDVSLVKKVAKNIANSELHVFDCGHLFAIDCNDKCMRIVKKFLVKLKDCNIYLCN